MSRLLKHFRRAVLVSLAAALLAPAHAAVLFTIERIDDTHARLVGSGTLGLVAPDANTHVLGLTDPFAIDPTFDTLTMAFTGGNLQVGGTPLDFAYTASPDFDLFGDLTAGLYAGAGSFLSFNPGDAVSGYIDIDLGASSTFLSAGSSGTITWGVVGFANPQNVGEWIMVDAPAAVPEPGSLALGGIALAGLLAARRRRD